MGTSPSYNYSSSTTLKIAACQTSLPTQHLSLVSHSRFFCYHPSLVCGHSSEVGGQTGHSMEAGVNSR